MRYCTSGNTTTVIYVAKSDVDYTITVPSLLAPGEQGKSVILDGYWPSNMTVNVTAQEKVLLTNSIDSKLTRDPNVRFEGISEAGNNIEKQTFTEGISVDSISNALFGTWSGIFYYNVTTDIKEGSTNPENPDDPNNPDTPENPSNQVTVNYIAGENGSVTENSRTFTKGSNLTFPEVMPADSYMFDKWVDASNDSEVTESTTVNTEMTVKALFKSDGTENPKEIGKITYKTTSYNNGLKITGVEIEGEISVANVPDNLEGQSVLAIGTSAFEGKNELTTIVLPSTIEMIEDKAFNGLSDSTIYVNSDVYQADGFDTFANVKELHVKTLTPGLAIDGVIDAIGEGIPTYVDGTLFVNENGAVVQQTVRNGTSSSSRWYMCVTESGEAIDLSSLSTWSTQWTYSLKDYLYIYAPKIITANGIVDYPKYVNGKLVTEIPPYIYYSTAIKAINFPNSITSIGDSAFRSCRSLTGDLVIPEGVTSIDNYAFYYCSGLTGDLVIPDSVTSIGNYAFQKCSTAAH